MTRIAAATLLLTAWAVTPASAVSLDTQTTVTTPVTLQTNDQISIVNPSRTVGSGKQNLGMRVPAGSAAMSMAIFGFSGTTMTPGDLLKALGPSSGGTAKAAITAGTLTNPLRVYESFACGSDTMTQEIIWYWASEASDGCVTGGTYHCAFRRASFTGGSAPTSCLDSRFNNWSTSYELEPGLDYNEVTTTDGSSTKYYAMSAQRDDGTATTCWVVSIPATINNSTCNGINTISIGEGPSAI